MSIYMIDMAEIRNFGNDHQAPFWVVIVLGNEAVVQGKNKLPYTQFTSDSKYLFRFRKPNKLTTRGQDQECLRRPYPPYGGAEGFC